MVSQKYQEFREMLKTARYAEAAHLAEQAYFSGNRNDPFWLTRQAAALLRAGKTDQSLEIAKQALSLKPADPYCVLAVADALFGRHQIEAALTYLREIADVPKLSSYVRQKILECLSETKQWDQILQLLTEWEMPDTNRYRWQVKALSALNRKDEAIDLCRRWLTIQPDHPQALWALTELEIQRDGLDSVLTRIGRISKISSRPPVYKEIYASLCRRSGKHELALKQYVTLSQSGVDFRIQRKTAFALAKSGKESQAIPMLEELLKDNPGDMFLNSSYKGACERTGQLQRALGFYEQLIVGNPEEKSLYGRIRKIKLKLGVNA